MIRLRESVAAKPDFVTNRGYAIGRPDGTTDILIRAGGKGTLHLLRADPRSQTGWTLEDTHQDFDLVAAAVSDQVSSTGYAYAGVGDDRKTWLFAVGAAGDGTPQVRSTSRAHGKAWPRSWSTTPIPKGVHGGTPPDYMELQPGLVDGAPVLLAWMYWDDDSSEGLWRIPLEDPGAAWEALYPTAVQSAWVETAEGPALIVGQDAFPDQKPTGFYLWHAPFTGEARPILVDMARSAFMDATLAVADVPGQPSRAYLYIPYTDARGIYRIDLSGQAAPTRLLVTDAPTHLYADASHGEVDLFYTDQKGRLFVMHEGTDGQLSTPVPLGPASEDLLVAHLTPQQTDLFFWTGERLSRMTWNPDDVTSEHDPGSWRVEEVELPGNQAADRAWYLTHLTLLDENGTPIADRKVTLSAGQDTRARILGRYRVLSDDGVGVTATSDASGSIDLYAPTDTIDAGELFVDGGTGKLPPVRRNTQEIEALAKLTADQVEAVLPAKAAANAEPLAEAVRAVAARALQAPPAAPGERTRLPGTSAGDGGWSFTYRDGKATYTSLPAAEARARVAAAAAVPSDALPDGTKTLWSYLGDLLEEAEEALATTFELVVETVEEGTHFVLTVVTSAGTFVYQAVHGLVDEAVAFAETILGLFLSALETLGLVILALEHLAADIWRTKTFIEGKMTEVVPTLRPKVRKLAKEVQGSETFDPKNLSSLMATLHQQVGSLRFDGAAASGPTPGGVGDSLAELVEKHSALLQIPLKYLGDKALFASLPSEWKTSTWAAALTEDFHAANSAVDKLFKNEALTDAIGTLTRKLANDGFGVSLASFEGERLSDLIGHTEGLGKSLLGHFRDIAPTLFEFIDAGLVSLEQLMATDLEPSDALRDLYNWLNPGDPEPVTAQGLAALLCAVPVTLISRLESGQSWADEAELPGSYAAVAKAIYIMQWVWLFLGAGIVLANEYVGASEILFPLFSIPVAEAILAQVLLQHGWEGLSSELKALYETEWVIGILPYLLMFPLGLLDWLSIAYVEWSTAAVGSELVPIICALVGFIGSFLVLLISLPQLAIAAATIDREHHEHVARSWKTYGELANPLSNFFQFIVGGLPIVPAMVTFAGNALQLNALEQARKS